MDLQSGGPGVMERVQAGRVMFSPYLCRSVPEYPHRLEALPQLGHVHLPIFVGVEPVKQCLV